MLIEIKTTATRVNDDIRVSKSSDFRNAFIKSKLNADELEAHLS